MTVDFFHNQIIKDTVTPVFMESFNENFLPSLSLRYENSLDAVQFYDNHIADGFRIGGIFYYPLTVVISGVAKTEWICWQVSNYRIYDNFNPFSYKGQELLTFSYATKLPEGLSEKLCGMPIYSDGDALPVVMNAATDDKTFLAGKYSQGFIDLMASELTDIIEHELAISGLAESGVTLEMNFAPGTYMEHIAGSTTYRRLSIKARGCGARDLWIKWTRLDGKGTYTISDNVDKSMISFELAEDVPGKFKEREYRYLASSSADKFLGSMKRKNITEWREMMRRVIRRGEVERYERITISKKPQSLEPAPEIKTPVNAVKISTEAPRERDEITERLNALLGKSDVEFSKEPESLAESINSDLSELLRGALGMEEPAADAREEAAEELTEEAIEPAAEEIIEPAAEEMPEADPEPPVSAPDESEEEALEEITENEAEKAEDDESTLAQSAPERQTETEGEIEARIRRELEEKMREEMEELRRKNAEAEAMRERLEAQRRAEEREKELLAEAARKAVFDTEKREADRRAEQERDRLERERRAEEERLATERARAAEAARIEAEMRAEREKQEAEKKEAERIPLLTKTVNLIFRRGGVDKAMIKRVREIIVTAIKLLGKEGVYMKIKAQTPDPNTLTLTFSELPATEEKLIIDIIQVLGKSGLGITKATLE